MQHYDLSHGFCSYTFFEQCPHRMACACCDFHTPKESSKSQLLQAKSNLQRILVNIPLTDDEQAAIEDGQAALKCVYMAIMSTDPTGKGRQRWMNRWKAPLNAFELAFPGRLTLVLQP